MEEVYVLKEGTVLIRRSGDKSCSDLTTKRTTISEIQLVATFEVRIFKDSNGIVCIFLLVVLIKGGSIGGLRSAAGAVFVNVKAPS